MWPTWHHCPLPIRKLRSPGPCDVKLQYCREVNSDVSVFENKVSVFILNFCSTFGKIRTDEKDVFSLLCLFSVTQTLREGDEGEECGDTRSLWLNPPSSRNVTSSHAEIFWRDSGKCGEGGKVSVNAKCNVLCTMMHPGDFFGFLWIGALWVILAGYRALITSIFNPPSPPFFLKRFYCVKYKNIYSIYI